MSPEQEKLREDLKRQDSEFAAQATQESMEKVERLTAIASAPTKETLAALLTEAANKGIMPRHALQLGDDTMEAIYSQGYNLYNQGRYKEASYIFRLLMLLDYMTPKYILGLAACLHRMKDYKSAANIYQLCGVIDPKNPLPHYHAADCYIQLGVPILAIFSLNMAIVSAGDQPQYAVVKERATLMKDALHKQVHEESMRARKEEQKT